MVKGEAGGGMAGTAAQLGAGLAMGQQMMAAMGGTFAQQAPAAPAPPPLPGSTASAPAETGKLELLSPGDVANLLGVSEGDVLATLSDGSLKGKKIGSTWRITRQALDEFLRS
jgi:excisionase family DNA binding protein